MHAMWLTCGPIVMSWLMNGQKIGFAKIKAKQNSKTAELLVHVKEK